uniref:Cdc42-interacting protein 4 homolog n=1 Tax=Sinocyclocheilus grahami TaxID=75366 RepID=A0A672MKU1_SINGR
MDWGTELWDQCDIIDKHTQSGLDLVEKYVKFVKERTEIEQNYAKQLRNLTKKYSPKRGSKEEQECRFSNHQAFLDILNEMNDYTGQRELIAENMMINICIELTKYLQELKQERKMHLSEAKKAQQSLESTYKQLDNSKKRFEREWREAEKAAQCAEKTDQDLNATKADVEKAKQQAHMRTHIAEECKNDYASQLQKYNKEQNQFYFTDMPLVFNRLQDMDERRIKKLAHGYILFADTERHVMPIIGKCLEGMTRTGTNVNERNDSVVLIEQHKSGFERPGDVEFEDYSQGINRASSDSSLGTPKGPLELLGKNKNKTFRLFNKKSKVEFNTKFSCALFSPGTISDDTDSSQAIYTEFDDDFEEEELAAPIGQCTALYNFPGSSEGTISMQEGEVLSVVEEDKGDGWTRVRRNNRDEGYIPTSYATITLNK